jgi:hypothetical protein
MISQMPVEIMLEKSIIPGDKQNYKAKIIAENDIAYKEMGESENQGVNYLSICDTAAAQAS